jgi:SAM-dependent methyltransferase
MNVTQRRLRFIWRYLRGDVPWDSGIVPPEITAWTEAYPAAPGRALDIGCGTGTTALYLAGRGWTVVGVDFVPNAIWRARSKARSRRVAGRAAFRVADVSQPGFLAGEAPFDLAIDVGCLHGLTPEQRRAYAAHLIRLTTPGAAYLLYAFMPRLSRDGTRQIGIDRAGLEALFGGAFDVVEVVLGTEVTTPVPNGWYTLRRGSVSP